VIREDFAMTTKPGAGPSKRRRWSLSLRAALLLVLVVGAGLGLWARWTRLQAQRRAVGAVLKAGGSVASGKNVISPAQGAASAKGQDISIHDRLRVYLGGDSDDPVLEIWAPYSHLRNGDLVALQRLDRLESLNVSGTGIDDAGLPYVGRIRSLRSLHLGQTRITDDGLRHLMGLNRLEHLDLSGTSVTDDGLRHLEGLRALKLLFVHETRVTDEGAAEFRRSHPRVRILHRFD
jgi:hypothetical protein